MLEIGDILKVQRQEHILLNEPAHHIVRRNDHIHGDTAVGHLGVHGLIGVKGHIIDPDVGIGLLELGDDIDTAVVALGDVLAPVVDIDGDPAVIDGAAGKQRQQQHGRQGQAKDSFHAAPPRLACFLSFFSCSRFMMTISTKISKNSMVNMA